MSKDLYRGSNMKLGMRQLIIAATLAMPVLAQATDVTGMVGQIEVNGTGSNGSFRVYTATVNNMCDSNVTEAIINTTDPNYSTIVATLLMAKALGATVVFSSTQQPDGTCHLYYVVMK